MKKTIPPPTFAGRRVLILVAGAVLVWFALSEVVSQGWYLIHESKLPRNPVPAAGEEVLNRIHAYADENGAQSSVRDVGAAATDILKCSYGKTIVWSDFAGAMSAATVLKWDDRSVVGGVESMHNPGNCLRAAGWAIGERTFLGVQNYCGVTCEVTKWQVSQGNTQMQAYSAVFRRYSETEAEKTSSTFWNDKRLTSVLSGRRDAPVMIFLAYLPLDSDGGQGDERFQRIMKSVFCNREK